MLRRNLTTRGLVAVALAAALLGWAAAPAAADHEVYCPPDGGDCIIKAHKTGEGGRGGGGGGGGACFYNNAPVDCYIEGLGWYNPRDECYYRKLQPQPPAGDPLWEGHDPSEGAVYSLACYPELKPRGGIVFLTNPPPGFGGLPSPAELAAQAINRLPIRGPDIGIAPAPSGSGLVGLPVWMWTAVTPATWGPSSATASVPGLSVTATARAQKIVWNMGDGTPTSPAHTVTCTNPGTPYKPEYGRTPSPTCGFDTGYARPSNPRYTVTATTTWHVIWTGGGQSGTLDVTRASTTSIDIDELQVVTR